MTTICIVRHGETDWNAQKRFQGREDIELNENGKGQACVVANYLKKSEWDVIISSPLKRASMTAEIIGKHLGLSDVITLDAFIERDFGKASGMTLEQQKIAFLDGIIPEKESDDDFSDRTVRGLESLVKEYNGKNIILVSHGAVINSLLKAISNNSINIGETLIKNTCVNIIKYIDDTWHIELYNSVDYITSPVDIAKNHFLGKEGCKCLNCAQSVIRSKV